MIVTREPGTRRYIVKMSSEEFEKERAQFRLKHETKKPRLQPGRRRRLNGETKKG